MMVNDICKAVRHGLGVCNDCYYLPGRHTGRQADEGFFAYPTGGCQKSTPCFPFPPPHHAAVMGACKSPTSTCLESLVAGSQQKHRYTTVSLLQSMGVYNIIAFLPTYYFHLVSAHHTCTCAPAV